MNEQLITYIQSEADKEISLPRKEEIELGGEKFIAQRGFASDIIDKRTGELISTTVNVYRHLETGMVITVQNYGPDKPDNYPIPIRMDYGCTCMNLSPNQSKPTHDCSAQRDLAQDTMTALKIGVMATIDEQTAAGNGHGPEASFAQETINHNERARGKLITPMQEAQSQAGYFGGDIRRHSVIAKVIKDTIGDRVAIPMTSNTGKIKNFIDAGINVMPNMRIELITAETDSRHANSGRRDYDHLGSGLKPGAYLVNGHSIRLTPKVYNECIIAEPRKPILNFSLRRFRQVHPAN